MKLLKKRPKLKMSKIQDLLKEKGLSEEEALKLLAEYKKPDNHDAHEEGVSDESQPQTGSEAPSNNPTQAEMNEYIKSKILKQKEKEAKAASQVAGITPELEKLVDQKIAAAVKKVRTPATRGPPPEGKEGQEKPAAELSKTRFAANIGQKKVGGGA